MSCEDILATSFPFDLPDTYDFAHLEDDVIFNYDVASTSISNLYMLLKNEDKIHEMISYVKANLTNLDVNLLSKIEQRTNLHWSHSEENMKDLISILEIISKGLEFSLKYQNKEEARRRFCENLYSH